MKTLIYTIIIFMLPVIMLGQENSEQSGDTLYILYNSRKHQVKEDPIGFNRNLEPVAVYKFIFDEESKVYFTFLRAKFLNFDAISSDTPADTRTIKRCFIRANKEQIRDVQYFRNLGIEKSFWYLHKFNKIYLIDRTEIKGGMVPMYEVGVYSTYTPPF